MTQAVLLLIQYLDGVVGLEILLGNVDAGLGTLRLRVMEDASHRGKIELTKCHKGKDQVKCW